MSKAILLVLLLFLSGLTLAEPTAEVEQPKAYLNEGLSFTYPGNWSITEDEEGPEARYVFVESEGGAIIILFLFHLDESRSLLKIAQEFSKATAESTPFMDLKSAGFKEIADDSGERLRESVRVKLFGQVEPHLREYLLLKASQRKIVLVSQIAVEDLAEAGPGFRLVEKTLRFEAE